MVTVDPGQIHTLEIVRPCEDLGQALDYYQEELGFRLEVIFPADAPRVAKRSGHGLHIQLEQSQEWPYLS